MTTTRNIKEMQESAIRLGREARSVYTARASSTRRDMHERGLIRQALRQAARREAGQ
jgi:hypothetical protein